MQLKEKLISKEEIENRIIRLAREIERDYAGQEVVLVGILKGSFIFLSDLSRWLELNHTIDFISVSSYGDTGNEQGEVKLLMDTSQNLAGKHVILVEDIVDSGNTIKYIMDIFKTRHINSIKVCSLIKRNKKEHDGIVDYYGFIVNSDKWLVGYGLDYKEQYRTLPYIQVIATE